MDRKREGQGEAALPSSGCAGAFPPENPVLDRENSKMERVPYSTVTTRSLYSTVQQYSTVQYCTVRNHKSLSLYSTVVPGYVYIGTGTVVALLLIRNTVRAKGEGKVNSCF